MSKKELYISLDRPKDTAKRWTLSELKHNLDLSSEAFIPNEETIEAMKEARHGKLESFGSVEDLMKNLKAK